MERRRSPNGRGAGWPPRFARSPPLASARVRSPYPPHSQAAFARAHAGLCTFLHDALALGTPWHLARLGTWHVFVVIVLPWIMPARLVFSSCVLAARARRACPSAPVGGRPGTWLDLALGTRVEQFLHRCFAGTHAVQAHMHCSTHWADACGAVDLYPFLQERGWDGYHP